MDAEVPDRRSVSGAVLTLIAASAGGPRPLAIGQVPWLLGVDDQSALFNLYGWKDGLLQTADEVVVEDVVAALAGDRVPVVDRDVFALVVRLSQRLRELAQAQPSTATYLRCAFAGSWPVAEECLRQVDRVVDEQLRASPQTRDELTSARALPIAQLVLAPALLTQPAPRRPLVPNSALAHSASGGDAGERPQVLAIQEVEWRVVAVRHQGSYTDASSVGARLFIDAAGEFEGPMGHGRFLVSPDRLKVRIAAWRGHGSSGIRQLVLSVGYNVLASSPLWSVAGDLATLVDEQAGSALVLQRR